MTYILITGASSGIGFAITKLLSKHSFNILATARNQEDIDQLQQLEGVSAAYLDITNEESIDLLIEDIEEEGIQISTIINNAGILHLGLLLTSSREQIDEIFTTNVFGMISLIKKLLPQLIRNQGLIINISSDSGLATQPYSTLYSMSKYSVEALSDGLRHELAKTDVNVVLVEPGNTKTDIMKKAISNMRTIGSEESLFELHNKVNRKLKDINLDEGQPPIDVAKTILHIMKEKQPKPRYFVGSKDELNYAIDTLLERVIQINQNATNSLTLDELEQRMNFFLNL